MRRMLAASLGMACAAGAWANEVTIQNDSLTDFDSAGIVWGFAANEKAASWLTTPCTGDVVAVQIFWRSPSGTEAQTIEDSIDIYRSATFPDPGVLATEIGGPVLNDNVLNEYRYLDENNTIPLSVPVIQDDTFVVALTFASAPQPNVDPSVVRDTDGIQPGRNTIYGDAGTGLRWYDSADLGLTGDWVIRAVVNCQAGASNADVGVTMSADPPDYTAGAALSYAIVVANGGPAASPNTTVVDVFPTAYTGVTWTCAASGGASCTSGASGAITQAISLPAGSQVVYTTSGTIASGTTGGVSNSATAVVGAPATDPDNSNNTATLELVAAYQDEIFTDGFDPALVLNEQLESAP